MGDAESDRAVELPTDVVDRIEARVPYTEFESPEEYITYVLKEVLYHVEEENDLSDAEEVDEDQVRDRLKSLGYLNE